MGGSTYACSSGSLYSGSAYNAFDNASNTQCWMNSTAANWYVIFYSPFKFRATSVTVTNFNGASSYANYFTLKTGMVYGSNDNVSYTELHSFTNTSLSYGATWTQLFDNNRYFKYYKLQAVTINSAYSNEGWAVANIIYAGYKMDGTSIADNAWASDYQSDYFIKY